MKPKNNKSVHDVMKFDGGFYFCLKFLGVTLR